MRPRTRSSIGLCLAFALGFVAGGLTLNLIGLSVNAEDAEHRSFKRGFSRGTGEHSKRFSKGRKHRSKGFGRGFSEDFWVDYYKRKLELSDEQAALAAEALKRGFKRYKDAYETMAPQMQEIDRINREEFEVFLTPEQTERFREIMERFKSRSPWQKREGKQEESHD